MKKYFIFTSMLFFGCFAMAQQKPHYTQYILNQYVINPALSGIENYIDIKASHRMQWVGLLDAPVTTYLTINGPIGKSDDRVNALTMRDPAENPRGRNYWADYVTPKPHHGWGLQVINDRTGPLNNFNAFGTYAYHIGLSARNNLAAGIGLGISNLSINRDKLQFNTQVDPAVYSSGVINKIRFDMNAGLYFYSADYFIGLSALQIFPAKVDFSNNIVKTTEGKSVPHIFATAGYRFLIGDNFNFIPSLLAKYVQPVPLQVDVNAKLQYRDFLWIGASYRHNDGIAAMAGLSIAQIFTLGYSYDYTTSRLNNYTKGTHEIVVGFTIGNKYGDTCPRNVW